MKPNRPSLEAPDEGYFASFTDMLVGIIFIFIILLMIVAHDYQSATESITNINRDLERARNETRDRERDIARDRERDAARDRERDIARDRERDAARDRAREATHSKIIAAARVENAKAIADQAEDYAVRQRLQEMQQNQFNDSRGKVLLKIQEEMNRQGYAVTADVHQGILVIPENILFYPADGNVHYMGRQALRALAGSFGKYLPCISPTANPSRRLECDNLGFVPNDGLDVIFIDDYPGGGGSRESRLLLAVQRVVSIFGEFKSADPYLDKGLKNKYGIPILDVKVNKERRDAKDREYHHAAVHESVVLRFIMRQPDPEDMKKLRSSGQ